MDLTPERVRQLKVKALKKLKNKSKNRLLRSYLG
jgi:DNA-directed RNA polymerase sigma subunit (sigma70/sigma32)